MNVSQILKKTVSFVTLNMHKSRRNSLIASVGSLVSGASATVTDIGRGIHSHVAEKHKIKRSDRLLSNGNLLRDLPGIYTLITQLFTSLTPNPVIHIDWSDLDEYGRHFLLRASLAFDGRSITLYEEIHDVKNKEKPSTHKQFLKLLKAMLP